MLKRKIGSTADQLLLIPRMFFSIAFTACLALSACGAPVTSSTSSNASEQPTTMTVEGILTRKGTDMDGWWALTTAQGKTWRVEVSDKATVEALGDVRHHTVRVTGVRQADLLATPVLRLTSWNRVP